MGSAASTLKDASHVRKREAYMRELEATVQSLAIQNAEYSKRAEVAGKVVNRIQINFLIVRDQRG